MAYTTIKKPSDYFNTVLYTGNASTQSITGVGFQPDMCWFKVRNNTDTHAIFDAVRGVQQRLIPNNNSAEGTQSNGVTSFDSDGFTSGDANITNGSGRNYASWNWLASNTTASNTDGSITSTVSANTTSGFSIVSYTGTGANATVGHGLGVAPSMVICKSRTTAEGWGCYHKSLGATKLVYLNDTTLPSTLSTYWQDTAPSSTVVTLGSNHAPNEIGTMIMYCFAEKKGFSKFGSYTGNGNADGTFVYTGFKPAMVIVKNITTATSWQLVDNKRSDAGGYNIIDKVLAPNGSDAEYDTGTSDWIVDFVSNGFKLRGNYAAWNTSGNTYIYMAFAEEPLVGDNPATAR